MATHNGVKHIDSPRARQFIFDALHLDRARLRPSAAAAMQEHDWDYVLRAAQIHRLGPMLSDRISRSDLTAHIPGRVRDRFQAAYRNNSLRNLKIYRELVAVTRILDMEQIPSIALKGAYLALYVYPAAGLRPMRDLDLLLRPEQAVEAYELLKDRGYQAMFGGMPEAHFAERRHLPPLQSPGGICIELHPRLISPDPQQGHASDFGKELWARCKLRNVGGMPIRFFCPEELLLHLCIHASLEHKFDIGPLALVDVALLVETHRMDWQSFLQVAMEGKWERYALSVLYLTKHRLGAQIPDEVIEYLGGGDSSVVWLDAAEYLLFSEIGSHNLPHKDMPAILYQGNVMGTLFTLAGIVFPPRSAISLHFPVSAVSPKAFMYYPMYWSRLLTQKLPILLRAVSGRKGAIKRLAKHRETFYSWLSAANERHRDELEKPESPV